MNWYPIRCGAALLALQFFFAAGLRAQPAGFTDQVFLAGWNQVVGFTWDGNGRMYVWEKGGRVWVVQNGVKLPTPLLDISDEVGNWRDFGLLGFALDPNFLTNGYFYLNYVVDRHHLLHAGTPSYDPNANEYFDATIGRVTRYQADPATNFTTVVPGSRQVLIGETKETGMPILHESHGVGALVFGTDGTLLVCMGDGASYSSLDEGSASETYWLQALNDGIITAEENIGAYRCQILNSLNGKILRIDPQTGDGLPSNPFYDPTAPRAPRSRIWSLGVRNPYRMCLKPGTGSHHPADADPGVFFFGDVGWGTWEDLNVITGPGQNFGWPKFEGITYQPGYNDPAYAPGSHEPPRIDWRHGQNNARGMVNGTMVSVGSAQLPGNPFPGNASTGGVWYTGDDFPPEFKNTYFHGDYGAKWIRNFVFDADHNPLEVKNFIDNAGNCVFLNTHPTQGGLWYVRYPDQIRKVSYTGNLNRPPVATPEADALHGPAPLTVQFTGDQSFDPDFDPLSYLWEFGDGNSSTEANPLHTFNAAGGAPTAFTVTLTVSDDQGASDQKTLTITLNNTPPVIQSTSLDNLSTFSVSNPTTLSLSATVSDAEHPNAQLSWSWEVALHHNDHNHPEAPIQSPSGTALLTPVGCDGATYWYRIRLTVSDPLGAAAVFVKDLFPDCPGSAQTLTFPPVPDKLITDGPFDPGASASSGLPVQYFVAGGPAAVSGGVISLTGEPGLVTLVATQPGDGTFAPAAPVERQFRVLLPPAGNCSASGTISREVWTNVGGTSLSQIPLNAPPNLEDELSLFEIPVNALNNYGTRLRGYLCPPATGFYTFWISSDDNGALYLSSNADPANKTLIASVPTWTSSRQWNKFPEQQSAPVFLVAGQPYYIEALQKEGSGGDNLAVGWQLPDGTLERPIPGSRLSPWTGGKLEQTISFAPIPDKLSTDPPFNLTATASSGLPVSFTLVSGPATLSGNLLTLTGTPGTVTVRASQPGDATYHPAPDVEQSFTVSAAPPLPTLTITAPASGAVLSGTEVLIEYSTAGDWAFHGADHLLFYLDGVFLFDEHNPTGSYLLTGLPAGPHTFTAQIADAQHNPFGHAGASASVDFSLQPAGGNAPDLELSLSAGSAELTIWQDLTFSLTLTNAGSAPATGIRVAAPVPAGFAYTASSASAGAYDLFFQHWDISQLAPGASATLDLVLFVLQDQNPATYFAQVLLAEPADEDSTPGNNATQTPTEDDEAALTLLPPGSGPLDQTIDFPPIPDKLTTDPPFTLNATASSGLPVGFELVSGPASLSGNLLTLSGQPGLVTIRASQSGNANWNPAPDVLRSFAVSDPAAQEQTIDFPPIPDKLTTDPPFTLNATASSGLPVGFELVSGPASLSGNTLTLDGIPGTVVVRATQPGNADFNPAPPVERSFLVTLPGGGGPEPDLELGVAATSSQLNIYQNVTFTLTLENKGFSAAQNIVVEVPIPAGFAYVGSQALQGTYDAWLQKWSLPSLEGGAAATMSLTLFVLQDQQPSIFYTQVFQATPTDLDSAPGNNPGPSPIEDDEAALTLLPPGSGPLEQTIDFPPISDKVSTDPPFTLSATASSGLPVQFALESGPATLAGNVLTLTGEVGTVVVRASQGGNADFLPAPDVLRSFTVSDPAKLDQTITFEPLPDRQVDDPPFTLNATASSGLPVQFSIVSGPANLAGNTLTLTGTPGIVTVEASQPGDATYNPAPLVRRSFSVNAPPGANQIDLELTLSADKSTLDIWHDMTFTLEITNKGAVPATNVQVHAPVSSGLAYTAHTQTAGSYDLFFERWNIASLAPGQSATLELVLFVLQDQTPLDYAVEVLQASPEDSDSSPGNYAGGLPAEDDEALLTVLPPSQGATQGPDVLSLSAIAEGTTATLRWVTNRSRETDWFIIEHSPDGVHFEPIAELRNRRRTDAFIHYEQKDLPPAEGNNYFRIRQIFADGSVAFSNVQWLHFSGNIHEFVLFPNPASRELFVNLHPVRGQEVRLRILDLSGRVLLEELLPQAPTAPYRLDIGTLRDGKYLLWILPAERKALAKAFVVAR